MACASAFAMADAPKPVDVEAGELADALERLARQCGVDVIYPSSQLKGLRTRGVSGTLDTKAAFRKLIEGTPLMLKEEGGALLIVLPASPKPTAAPGSRGVRNDAMAPTQDTATNKEAQKTSFWERFRLAEAAEPSASAVSAGEPGATTPVEEIVVSAQKRPERLQDVPVPVTAMSAQSLIESNQLRIQDYYTRVPGLVVSPTRQQNFLAIRGITSGGPTNPTVGVTIDDMPYGASTNIGGGAFVPDFDPGELAQIEVLRGPQGTLYGASSMGGLIKFVTADPSTESFKGRAEAGVSGVRNGNELGYSARGSVNVPVSDTVAVRASAFRRRDAGYIDNVRTGEDAVNSVDATGGHLSALFRLSDTFSLKLGALFQELKDYGSYDVDVLPGLGDLQHSRLPGTGRNERKAQAYSAVVKGELGAAELTSITGYNITTESDSFDFGFQVGAQLLPLFAVSTGVLINDIDTRKFSQELRLTLPLGSRVDWLIGGFYTHEKSLLTQDIWPADPASGVKVADWSFGTFPTRYEEYAALTDFTFHVTDRFDVQVGGRQSRITSSSEEQLQIGPRFPPTNLRITPAIDSRADVFTYLLTPSFKLTPDLMFYARLASGYRAGGPNGGAAVAQGLVPRSYAPDKTKTYEVGFKGDFLDRRLSVDTSVYSIDWSDIQLTVQNLQNGQFYTDNADRATSQGVELSVDVRPWSATTFVGWVAYSDATLSDPFPAGATVYGVPGNRLPFSAKWSGNVSANREFPVTGTTTGFVGGALAYVGERIGLFRGLAAGVPLARQVYPSYTKLDVQAGLRMESWTTSLFVNNVADKRGVLNGGPGTQPPFGYQYIQPRTYGVSLAKTF